MAGAVALAEGCCESVPGGLGQGTTAVIYGPLPVWQTEKADFLDRLVAGLPVHSVMEDCAFTWRGEKPGLVVFRPRVSIS